MPEINADTVPGSVPVPLWLLASLFLAIILLAGWAIRRKDARDAEREKRANAQQDEFNASRLQWTEAILKMAVAQEATADNVERMGATLGARLDRLENLVLNGHRKVGA